MTRIEPDREAIDHAGEFFTWALLSPALLVLGAVVAFGDDGNLLAGALISFVLPAVMLAWYGLRRRSAQAIAQHSLDFERALNRSRTDVID